MPAKLDRIFNFVKRTQDKAVVFVDDGEFVVMPLDAYEKLLGYRDSIGQLSESEMLDKINRDIAVWRASQNVSAALSANHLYSAEAPFTDSADFNSTSAPLVVEELPDDFMGQENDDDYGLEDESWADESDLVDSGSLNFNEPGELDDEGAEDFGRDYFDKKDWNFSKHRRSPDFSDSRIESTKDDLIPYAVSKSRPTQSRRISDQPSARINNFGYPNPPDTTEKSDEFGHISPPPDIVR